jgi:chemotaxis signal transduction protein
MKAFLNLLTLILIRGKLEPLIDLLMLFGLHQQPTSAIQSILSHEKNRISIQIYT